MAKIPKARKSHSRPKEPVELTVRLYQSFAEAEILELLAGCLRSLDEQGYTRLGTYVDLPLAQLARELVLSEHATETLPTKHQPQRGISSEKQWAQLCTDWEKVLRASNSIKSRYIQDDDEYTDGVAKRKHYLEMGCPYLSTDHISKDIDHIAEKMLSLLASDQLNHEPLPDLAGLLLQSNRTIGKQLPAEEFSDTSGIFGPATTQCYLTWQWQEAKKQPHTVEYFLSSVRSLMKRLDLWSLDFTTVLSFLLALSREERAGVYEILANDYTTGKLTENDDGPWFSIFLELAKEKNDSFWLMLCEKHYVNRWALAIPLLTNHLQNNQVQQATQVAVEAARTLATPYFPHWAPSTTLFAQALLQMPVNTDRREYLEFFGLWANAAKSHGQEALYWVLWLQSKAIESPGNLEQADNVFRQIPKRHAKQCRPLYKQWQSLAHNLVRKD